MLKNRQKIKCSSSQPGKMWIFIQMLLSFFSQAQIKHVSKAAKIIITKSVSHCPSLKHQQNNYWTYQKIHTGVSGEKAMVNLPILVSCFHQKLTFIILNLYILYYNITYATNTQQFCTCPSSTAVEIRTYIFDELILIEITPNYFVYYINP